MLVGILAGIATRILGCHKRSVKVCIAAETSFKALNFLGLSNGFKGIHFFVMAGLVPAIHVFVRWRQNVDARDICAKTRFALLPGHDEH
jgi:hypothetical protein